MVTEVTFFQEQIRDYPLLRVRGRIRMPDLERWSQELSSLVDRSSGDALLDMTTCSFFPSLAIPPLLQAHDRLRHRGNFLHVAVEGELRTVIRYLRLDAHLSIHDDLQACVEAASPRSVASPSLSESNE